MADDSSRKGTTYADEAVVRWLNALHAPHDESLARAFAAPAAQNMPAIQVGPSEGRTLMLLLRLVGARRAVEIGTLAGYSAIWIAHALGPDGRLDTIELDPRHAEVARTNLDAAGLGDRVHIHVGPALDVLATLEAESPFDAVFVDADKGNYDRYGRWAASNVRPGGLLLGDNAFFFGKLLDDCEGAAAMRRFHEEAREHFETVCIPTPDGLLLGIRR